MASAPDDYQHGNPIFAGRALTLPSTSSTPPEPPKKRSVPAAVGRIIGELGLRFRPAAQADLAAHAERLRLLTEDVADIPPHLLEAASKRWVSENRFLPTAAELGALARGQLCDEVRGTDHGLRQLQGHCDQLNAMGFTGSDPWVVIGHAPNRRVGRASERAKEAA
jgi:hypothetical protein